MRGALACVRGVRASCVRDLVEPSSFPQDTVNPWSVPDVNVCLPCFSYATGRAS